MFFPALFVASLIVPTSLAAQTPAPAATPATSPIAAANGDAILATWLHAACNHEIALATIAVKQAKHDDVRAFAQAIVDTHTAYAAKLQPFAAAADGTSGKGTPKANDGRKATEQTTEQATGRATDASVGRANATVAFDHVGLIRELAAKCLATESKQLTAKPAAEFDRCFVTMQLAAHSKGVDTLAVFRSRATPSLAAVIDEGAKLYASHHEQALGLQKKLAASVVEARGGR
ncbi:MAG: DUF4142 domain-containing protein [Planctomycetota bacterium]|jgi:predicted outer membrane protein